MGYSWNVAEHVKWWVISHCIRVEFGNCHCTATNKLSQSFKLSVMVMFWSSCSVFEFISISCDSNQYKGELHIFYIVCCVTTSTKREWLGSSLGGFIGPWMFCFHSAFTQCTCTTLPPPTLPVSCLWWLGCQGIPSAGLPHWLSLVIQAARSLFFLDHRMQSWTSYIRDSHHSHTLHISCLWWLGCWGTQSGGLPR